MKREDWSEHVKEQSSSGKSVAEYCRENNLSDGTFTYWKTKLSRSFVQVSGREPIEIVLSSGTRVHLPASSDTSIISKVLKAIDAKH